MSRFILLFLAVITFTLDSFAFKVEISDIPDSLIGQPLTLKSALDETLIDSITIESNSAVFYGGVPSSELAYVGYKIPVEGGVATYFTPVILDDGVAKVTFDPERITTIGGSRLNNIIADFCDFSKEVNGKYGFRSRESRLMMYNYEIELFKSNYDNPIGVLMLINLAVYQKFGNWEKLYLAMPADLRCYHNIAEYYRLNKGYEDVLATNQINDFEVKCADGTVKHLYDVIGKGKYVLLDFWAPWCGGCMREIYNVITPLYEKYKDKSNFEVVSVMTLMKGEDGIELLDKLPWTSLYDIESNGSTVNYFNTIPQIFLLNPDGSIYKSKLLDDELINAVEKVLGESSNK